MGKYIKQTLSEKKESTLDFHVIILSQSKLHCQISISEENIVWQQKPRQFTLTFI